MILKQIYRSPKKEILRLRQENMYFKEKAHQLKKEKNSLNQKLEYMKQTYENLIMERSRDYIRDVRLHHFIQDIKEENKKLKQGKEDLKKRLLEVLQEEKDRLEGLQAKYREQRRENNKTA